MTVMEIVVSVLGVVVGFMVVSALFREKPRETGEMVTCPDCRRETGVRGEYVDSQSCRWCNGLYWVVSDEQGSYSAVKGRPRKDHEITDDEHER